MTVMFEVRHVDDPYHRSVERIHTRKETTMLATISTIITTVAGAIGGVFLAIVSSITG